MKQVLVAGGAGFIGSHLTEVLLARGSRVVVLDDESTGSAANLSAVQEHFDLTYVPGSVADRPLLRKLLADVDEVYHLAATDRRNAATAAFDVLPQRLVTTQTLLEEVLAQCGQRQTLKVFLASGSQAYGKNPGDAWAEGDDSVFGPTGSGQWSGGVAQAASEVLALGGWRQHKLPVVVGRFFNICGPRQLADSGAVLPRFVTRALTGQPLVVHDDGRQVRTFLHVEDACRAAIELMNTPEATGKIVNIGGGEPITIFQLAERVVARIDPGLDVEFESYRHAYSNEFECIRRRVADLTLLRRLIDFEPRYDLDAILTELIDWTRNALRRG